nr:quinate 5-dehydrogenase [bacterium]
MKHVVSISLGSSARDHHSQVELDGELVDIERIGCDGDVDKFKQKLAQIDGKVDAIGLGGTTCNLYGKGGRKYPLKCTQRLLKHVGITPVVDGGGIKQTLEHDVVAHLNDMGVPVRGRKVLMVCGLERLGMSEALEEAGGNVVYGDLMFGLGINIKIKKLSTVHRAMAVLAPIIVRLPLKILYPTGNGQNQRDTKFGKAFAWADIIAGDYLYIRKHLPNDLSGKIIITNTVTAADTQELKERGARAIITCTPEFDGRSYGTNVVEAIVVALSGNAHLSESEIREWIDRAGLKPRIDWLNPEAA